MDERVRQCRDFTFDEDYIIPFFWQHGEDHGTLLREIEAIDKLGIRAFCAESRTHEQFCEEKWWQDFGFILEEAKKRGMHVYLLDDKRFPTGYANGYIEKHPELRKSSLRLEYYDYAGPMTEASLLVPTLDADERILSAVAYERDGGKDTVKGSGTVLTDRIKNGLITLDLPIGVFRVYYVIATHRTVKGREMYIDMLSSDSTRAMLHAVYEPHFAHFAPYFGDTFRGFFSDEPGFSNDANTYDSYLGRAGMLIPYRDGILLQLASQMKVEAEEALTYLPFLWQWHEEKAPLVRSVYMDTVTRAFRENFSDMLGTWCRDHGVSYIGHLIEDMNTHQRLGYGGGHFFRALHGQDMAGMDIVLHQVVPGHLELAHTASVIGTTVEPDFFRYTLPKLASSHAHIDAHKKGRAMCEIFGAYGWAEGVPMMKHLCDLALVSGINRFVPHAFNPKHPDPDCPPHFYASGTYVQYEAFGELMRYTSRASHLLSHGTHMADVAVYYNAEAEWAGGERMLQQTVCKALTRAHMDFDILPYDTVSSALTVGKDHRIYQNGESYGALIVPYSEFLPSAVIDAFEALSEKGARVIFVRDLPRRTCEGGDTSQRLRHCTAVQIEDLSLLPYRHARIVSDDTHLRFYHIKDGERERMMLWNESTHLPARLTFDLDGYAGAYLYDAVHDRHYAPSVKGSSAHITLSPEQSLFVILEKEARRDGLPMWREGSDAYTLPSVAEISVLEQGASEYRMLDAKHLHNLAGEMPFFCGTVRYRMRFSCVGASAFHTLSLGKVGEVARVSLNGKTLGISYCTPHELPLAHLREGENELEIEVCSSSGYKERDGFSRYLPLPPTGLLGAVRLLRD